MDVHVLLIIFGFASPFCLLAIMGGLRSVQTGVGQRFWQWTILVTGCIALTVLYAILWVLVR
jgi:hypothetical protein